MATMDQRYFDEGVFDAVQARPALVTVRLFRSLPFSAREQLMVYRLRRDADRGDAERREAELFAQWDFLLGRSPGPRWLVHPSVADAARRALRDMEGVLCHVKAWVLLPTHIHILATACTSRHSAPGMQHVADAIKAPVAYRIRSDLAITGHIWEDGAHIHELHDSEGEQRVIRYLRYEAMRAGLVSAPGEWPWEG
jgi:REP element-mobilizing transposase RayT